VRAPEREVGEAMAQEPTEMVRAMIEEVYGAGKMELIPKLVNDDYVEHDPINGRIDRKGLEGEVRMWRTAFPDMRMEVIDIIASGDRVSVRWRGTGTHRGELAGMPATHKKHTTEGITMVRFRNGKASEAWVQYDSLGMMRQLGLAPEMGKTSPRRDGGRATAP
jgi:steroid delta-isomerase-like uncharacterized protein